MTGLKMKANIIYYKFNKGSLYLPANYRPISLTCVCSKLLEHIICKHMLNHFDRHSILTTLQHSFWARHSCETQLLLTSTDLVQNYENKLQTDVIVLDFSKAFDVVAHQRLLHKLNHYCVRGNILNGIKNFLTNRSQCVVVDGISSAEAEDRSPTRHCLRPYLIFGLY